MTGSYDLGQTEQAVARRLAGLQVDHAAMALISNLYRAAGAVRNHVERTVLARHDLTWTAWVVLWVVWVWPDIETRHAAAEAGISKSTLTGVVGTLERRGLITRRTHPEDGRRVQLALTDAGARLMTDTFPQFNRVETAAVAPLSAGEVAVLTQALRTMVVHLQGGGEDGGPAAAELG